MDKAATVAIGDIEITSVWDGTLQAKLDTVLRLDPIEAGQRIEQARRATGSDPLLLPVRAFLVRAGGRIALIDTGSGKSKGPSMGHLPASLQEIGVNPKAIDNVLLTHLHMDHIGGLVDDAGDPAFPNAELVMHDAEAAYFLDTQKERLDARSLRSIDQVRSIVTAYAGRVRRVQDGEGLPGVGAQPAPGHTPGHTAWRVSSKGKVAIVLGDVVHLAAIQLQLPHVPMIYDVDPDRAGSTRIAILDEVVRNDIVVAGAHLPDGGLGHIVRSGAGYAFKPVVA